MEEAPPRKVAEVERIHGVVVRRSPPSSHATQAREEGSEPPQDGRPIRGSQGRERQPSHEARHGLGGTDPPHGTDHLPREQRRQGIAGGAGQHPPRPAGNERSSIAVPDDEEEPNCVSERCRGDEAEVVERYGEVEQAVQAVPARGPGRCRVGRGAGQVEKSRRQAKAGRQPPGRHQRQGEGEDGEQPQRQWQFGRASLPGAVDPAVRDQPHPFDAAQQVDAVEE